MKARHKDTGEIIELAEEGILSSDGRRFCWYQVELLPEPIDEVQPSLPSNLDEAEFNYVKSLENAPADQGEELMICEAFKAGAEWMAGQGYTVDGMVICDKELTRGYKDIAMSIPDELKVDDKVTIQIRKRQ